MSRLTRSVAWVTVLLLSITTLGAAQETTVRRQGLWFNLGLGYGTADFNCSNCGHTIREGGASASIAFGATVNRHFLVGVESDGWYQKEGAVHTLFGNFTFVGYVYPRPTADLFLKAGVGSASYLVRNGESVNGSGPGFMAGAGYDIAIGRKTSFTPTVTFNFGSLGDQGGDRSVKINWLQLGASVTLP